MSAYPTAGMKDPVLVTGGTGFLGKRIVLRLLAQGRRVTVLARHASPELEAAGVRCLEGSIEDEAAVDRAVQGAGTVFHVAAKVGVWGSQEEFFRANVMGTRAVIDACRRHGVQRLVHTSTPSVVYNGLDLAGADETLPLTTHCPCAYPTTKAQAEREVLAANGADLRTVALRPHLIWGRGDPHLVPRILARARAGRLRIIGSGRNRVDMVHVDNAVDAHLLAERALAADPSPAAGRAYFITNGEPIVLWEWINALLVALDEKPVTRRIPLRLAQAAGTACEGAWSALRLRREPPLTRFVASELARDHWFSIEAARRDLGYEPRITMQSGTLDLIASLTEG